MEGKLRFLRHAAGERAFTLLETMIAMAIVVFVFTAVISVESAAVQALERSKRMNAVAMLAKQVITEAEMEIEGRPLKEIEKEKGAKFPAPHDDFRWTRVIKEIEFPDIIGGGGGGDEGGTDGGGAGASSMIADQVGKVMTKYLSDSMREMAVTIYWSRGEGEQSYTISTWLVDLNGEMRVNP